MIFAILIIVSLTFIGISLNQSVINNTNKRLIDIEMDISIIRKEISCLLDLCSRIHNMNIDQKNSKYSAIDEGTYCGIDFHQLFGDKAEEFLSVFKTCQLQELSPSFDKFMKENPEYDQYHQSTNN